MKYNSIFRSDLFTHQTIIVTGGGSGIGRCTAHELVSLGANVILIGRKEEKLTRVADEIREDYNKSLDWHSCDIRNEDQVKQVVSTIVSKHGVIHGLVNNAGGQFPSPLAQIKKKGFEAVVSNNLTGTFLMAVEVYNQSMQQHGGAIVNMLADMWNGMVGMAHSGAARAGVENLTKTAAAEWAASGVRVNAVAPGIIASSGLDSYNKELARVFTANIIRNTPMKRAGTESEISSAICFLLSEGAAFITGTTIRIDGGGPLRSVWWDVPDHNNSAAYNGFPRTAGPQILDEIKT